MILCKEEGIHVHPRCLGKFLSSLHTSCMCTKLIQLLYARSEIITWCCVLIELLAAMLTLFNSEGESPCYITFDMLANNQLPLLQLFFCRAVPWLLLTFCTLYKL